MHRDSFLTGAGQLLNDRPNPIEGESWGGYLLRLAARNAMGVTDLAALVGLSVHEALCSSPVHLLRQLGVSVPPSLKVETTEDNFRARPPEFEPWQTLHPDHEPMVEWSWTSPEARKRGAKPRTYVGAYGRTLLGRICPQCLKEDNEPFVRAAWDMPIAIACERHRVLLLDTCNQCGAPVDIFRRSVQACKCGNSYLHQSTRVAEWWVGRLQELFSEARIQQPLATFAPAPIMAQSAARVCNWIASPHSTGQRRPRTRDKNGFLRVKTACDLEALFVQWPRAMATSLSRDFDGFAQDRERVRERLGGGRFSAFEEVMAELRSFYPRELSPRRHLVALRNSQREVFGIKSLMKLTGLSYGTLVRCIDEGGLPDAKYSTDPTTGQRKFEIPGELYRTIAAAWDQTNSVEAAAQQVGCAPHAVVGLVKAGCVKSFRLPLTRLGKLRPRIDPEDLAQLATRLLTSAVHKIGFHSERVYFSSWNDGRTDKETSQNWRRILRANQLGILRIYKASASPVVLNDLFLRKSELQKLRLSQQWKKL